MIEIKDLIGLSKPLTRLIEVISEGVGSVSRSYLMRKRADAKAHEIRVISGALKDVAEQHHLPVVYNDGAIELWQKPEDKTLSLDSVAPEERLSLRLDYQERKRQQNIENVTSIAAMELSEVNDVPDEKPDEDWVTRFFTSAQNVSSEQMQNLWGRILAGEIKRPGTYSLRSLEFVRNVTKTDATHFEHVGRLATSWGSWTFIAMHDENWMKQSRDIYPGHHFAMGELGAMHQTSATLRIFRDETREEVFTCGTLMLLVKRSDIKSEIKLPVWTFTNIGQELLKLISSANDEGYLESLGRFFLKHKGTPSLAKIIEHLSNGGISYQLIREISTPTEPDSTLNA